MSRKSRESKNFMRDFGSQPPWMDQVQEGRFVSPIKPRWRSNSYGSYSSWRSESEDQVSQTSKKRKTLKDILSDFADTTSMSGVIHIKTSTNWLFRLFWIVCTIGALAASTLHMYWLTKLYSVWPKQTEIQLEFSTLHFPAVTICNTNSIRYSHLFNLSDTLAQFANLVSPEQLSQPQPGQQHDKGPEGPPREPGSQQQDKGSNGSQRGPGSQQQDKKPDEPPSEPGGGKTFSGQNFQGGSKGSGQEPGPRPKRSVDENFLSSVNMAHPLLRKKRFIEQMEAVDTSDLQKVMKHDRQQERDDRIGPRDAYALIMAEYKMLYSSLDTQTRFEAGHQVEDLILSCSFRGRECQDKFKLTQSLDYGNCYTIESDDFIVDSSGPNEGLSIVLFMENNEYVKGVSNGYGARMVIHDRNTTDFPTEEGFFVSSQTETNIGLRLVEIIRLDRPYGNCTDGGEFQEMYSIKYTRQTCQRFCELRKVITTCKCYSRSREDVFIKMNQSFSQKFEACSSDSELDCMYGIEDQIRNDKSRSCEECMNPCVENVYTRSSSNRIWPTDDYTELLFTAVCQKYGNDSDSCDELRRKTDMRQRGQNFLKLNIYFEDLNYEKVEENPSYEPEQFYSDIGGAIGLWIGLSLLSFLEIGQLLLDVSCFLLMKVMRRSRDDMEELKDSVSEK